MVIAKGTGKADALKAKARKMASPANVQSASASPTPITTTTETETPLPVTTETSSVESVGVSGNNAEGENLCKGVEEEYEDDAEEMLHEEDEKVNVEEEDDADLVNFDGSVGALGMELEKADKTQVVSGNAQNNMVDGLIKEYINDVLYKEKDPLNPGTVEVLKSRELTEFEANTDAFLLGSESNMEGVDVTRDSSNITGEGEKTALVQAGEASGNKKVTKFKKIIKRKVVVRKGRVAPEEEAEPQLFDANRQDDETKDSGSGAKVHQGEKVEAGHVVSMLVPESDTKEENVTPLHSTKAGGEAKQTAAKLVSEDSVNEKVSKPKKVLKKKAIIRRRKVVPENAGEAQPLDANKSKYEVKDSSPSAKVNKQEISGARDSDAVNITKKVGKKKVQGPSETGIKKDGGKSDKTGSDKPHAEDNVNKELPVDVEENKEEKSDDGQKNHGKRDITVTDKAEVNGISADGKDKAETSNKKKLEAKAKNKGMIFMCSSKTKPDCYRYKVLGLPASKKDVVSKIYKGMRLFLFDVDLRLLYGIYEAAGPGGYSLEPKAFKSDFPSQVRFIVLEDCLPVAEEKFKKVIKDNYYSKNKFGCELSVEQVKNLCMLFRAGSKGKDKGKGKPIKPQQASGKDRVPPVSSSRKRDRSRKRIEDEPGRHHMERDKGYKRRAKDKDHGRRARDYGYDRQGRNNNERPARDIGYERPARDERFMHDVRHDWRPLPHERREAFVPVVAAPVPVPQALPPPLIQTVPQALPPPLIQTPARGLHYVYGNTSQPDIYHRDVAYERRDYGSLVPRDYVRGLEARMGFRDELQLRDPYDAQRDPRAYLRPLYHGTAAVQDPYEYPPAGHLARVGRPGVYHDADPSYRRY